MTGYSLLGKGLLLHNKEVQGVAKEMGVTPAQVLVWWSMQQGVVAIPKSDPLLFLAALCRGLIDSLVVQ